MMIPLPRRATTTRAAVIVAASVVITLVATFVISRVNPVDFLVYRYGAAAFASGGQLYSGNLDGPMLPHGGMPFTYTPFAALLLNPTTWLPWRIAYLGWTLACVLSLAWVLLRVLPREKRRTGTIVLVLTVASAATVVTQHLAFGQINLLLMALVIAGLLGVQRGHHSAAFLIGVAAAVKLTPALFIVYLLATRQWRAAAWSTAGAAAATALGALARPDLSVQFWTDVLWHLDSRVDLTGTMIATSGNNSIRGVLEAIAPGAAFIALPLALVVGMSALLIAGLTHTRGRHLDAGLIIGLTAPMLSPISWIHHWVYLLPALTVIAFRPAFRGKRALLAGALMLITPGPSFGDFLLSEIPLLWPLGLLWRESLLLVSIVGILTLASAPWSHDTATTQERVSTATPATSRVGWIAGALRNQRRRPSLLKSSSGATPPALHDARGRTSEC